MTTKVIINADDFGYTNSVNYGILDSHLNGVLTSTTLMPNMPGFNHAVAIKKATPTLGVGVHLVMTCGAPILKTHTELVDENGLFHKNRRYTSDFVFTDTIIEELRAEWTAQIDKVYAAGITPTHIDGHHHMFVMFPQTRALSIELAQKYDLPMRVDGVRITKAEVPETIAGVEYFEHDFDEIGFEKLRNDVEAKEAYYQTLLEKMKQYDTVEIMTHPAYISQPVMEGSSWNLERMYVATELMQSTFAQALKEDADFELVNYGMFQK